MKLLSKVYRSIEQVALSRAEAETTKLDEQTDEILFQVTVNGRTYRPKSTELCHFTEAERIRSRKAQQDRFLPTGFLDNPYSEIHPFVEEARGKLIEENFYSFATDKEALERIFSRKIWFRLVQISMDPVLRELSDSINEFRKHLENPTEIEYRVYVDLRDNIRDRLQAVKIEHRRWNLALRQGQASHMVIALPIDGNLESFRAQLAGYSIAPMEKIGAYTYLCRCPPEFGLLDRVRQLPSILWAWYYMKGFVLAAGLDLSDLKSV